METSKPPINGSEGVPPEAAAPPVENQPTPIDPKVDADMETLVRVAFAEKFAGFNRQLRTEDSIWVWHRASNIELPMAVVTEPVDVDGLPAVSNTGYALIEYLDQYCQHLTKSGDQVYQYLWCVQRAPAPGLPYNCLIARVLGTNAEVIARSKAEDPAAAIATTMLQLVGVDYAQLHRELFSDKYQADDAPAPRAPEILRA